jgi:hypothetical protein
VFRDLEILAMSFPRMIETGDQFVCPAGVGSLGRTHRIRSRADLPPGAAAGVPVARRATSRHCWPACRSSSSRREH